MVCVLPVHEPSLQGTVSLGGQGCPPCSSGRVMIGSLVIVPSPQVALHSLKGPHVHTQSTVIKLTNAKRLLTIHPYKEYNREIPCVYIILYHAV